MLHNKPDAAMGMIPTRPGPRNAPSRGLRNVWRLGRVVHGSGIPIALTASCALLTATTAFATPLTLTGNYLQAGISDYGTFGSNGSAEPGLLHDPSGTRNFYPNGIANDYLTPGTPHDGFAINSTQTGFITNDNAGSSAFGTTSPTLLTGKAAQGYGNAATWTSTYGTSLSITNSYFFNDADERIKVVSTVTALTALTNVAFGRSEDPDPDVNAFGSYSTTNTRGDSTTSPQNLVSAAGASTGLTIGILNGSGDTYSHNTMISTDCCSNADPYTVVANTDTLAYPNTNSGDYGLQMAWLLGDMTAGQSLTVVYSYVFGANQSDVSTGGSAPVAIDTANGDIGPSVFSLGSAAATASTVLFDGGTLQMSGGAFPNNVIAAPVVIDANNGTIDTSTGNGGFSGVVSGAGSLTIMGGGTFSLTAANTFAGGVIVDASTVAFGDAASLGTGALTLNRGTLQAPAQNGSNSDLVLGNAVKLGAGGGTVDIDGNSFTLAGDISNATAAAGRLTITNSTTVSNILTLSGTNSYTGGTVITGPTVVLAGAANVLGTGSLQLGPTASFLLGGFDQRVTQLTGTGSISNLGSFSADTTSTLTVQSGSFGGMIADATSGGFRGVTALTKASDGSATGGTLLLSGTSLYSGATTVSGGTLKAGSATGFSAMSAFTIASGATLDLNGFSGGFRSLAGQGTVTNGGARAVTLTIGADNTDPATTAVGFAGTLADGTAPVALVKSGTGTVGLSGTNTYSGGTLLQTGTLALGSGGALGSGRLDMAAGTTLAFTAGVTLANDIRFLAPTSGTATVEPSPSTTALAARIAGDPFIDTGAATDTLTGVLSGPGSLTKIGSGTLVLTGTETYTGITTVSAGTLQVDGSTAASATTVGSGATLSGSGVVGTLAAAAGATVSPGSSANPYGTLRTAGSATFAPTSTFAVAIDPSGRNSALAVNGTATLNGAGVAVSGPAGVYGGASYTILTATGGVQGVFGTVSTSEALAFLNPYLTYGTNAVSLQFQSNGVTLTDIAATPNQRSVAGALQSLDPNSGLARSLQGLSPDQARQALAALAGASHASVVTTATQDSRRVATQIFDRLWNIGGGEIDARTLLQQMENPNDRPAFVNCFAPVAAPPPPPATVYTGWGEAFGDFGHDGADRNGAGLDRSLGGFIIGYDAPVHGLGTPLRVGVAGGYTNNSFSGTGAGAGGSTGTFESVFGALYAGARFNAVDVRGGITVAGTSSNLSRAVVYPGFTESERSSNGGSTEQLFAEVGYRFSGTRWVVEPIVNAAYTHVHQDGYRERGGLAALIGYATDNDVGTTTLGARAEYAPFVGVPVVGRLFLGWRHAFGDVDPATRLAFEAGSIPFTSQGAAVDRNALASEVGLDYRYSGALTLGLAYIGQVGQRDVDNGIKGRAEYKF